MWKTRLALGLVLATAVGTIIGLTLAPFNGWVNIVMYAITAFVGLFAVAVGNLLLFTLFHAEKDLWKTPYFRYMRAFWGDIWGGPYHHTRPLQISTCKATWLSEITFFIFLLAVALPCFIVYSTVGSAIYGVEHTAWIWQLANEEEMFIGPYTLTLVLAWLVGGIVEFYLLYAIALRYQISNEFPKFSKVIWLAFIATAILTFTSEILIAPMQSLGALVVLKWTGIVLLGSGGVAVAVALMLGMILAGLKVSNVLSHFTVPGRLITAKKAFKENVCPLIIEGDSGT